MMIKICGITNRDDAQAAVDAGVTAIGFNFYGESPRYIAPTAASLIAEKLPPKVLKVGVFVDESAEAIVRVAVHVGLNVAQLHGTSAVCASLANWRAVQARSAMDVEIVDELVEAILLDTPSHLHGGTGKTFRWKIARDAAAFTSKKIIVAGGLDETNVEAAIMEAKPWGVDVCSRIESEPGRKDHVKMKRFIEAALSAQI